MDTLSILGSAAGFGLLAGIRLYATVFALGLAIRLGWFDPSEAMSQLHFLGQTPALVTSGVLCFTEFFADKIPWFDSIWDAVHTFIRPIGAAALGMTALGSFDPGVTVALGLLSGGVALTGHASKAATRLAANHSPEPVTNWTLSILEDLTIPFGLWVVIEHPLIALSIVAVFLVCFVLLARVIVRALRGSWSRARRGLARSGLEGFRVTS